MSSKVYLTFIADGKCDGFPALRDIDDDNTYILVINDIYSFGIGRVTVMSILYRIYDSLTASSVNWGMVDVKDQSIKSKTFNKEIDKIFKRIKNHVNDNCEFHINTRYSNESMNSIVVAMGFYMKYIYPHLNLFINEKIIRMNKDEADAMFDGVSNDLEFIKILKSKK